MRLFRLFFALFFAVGTLSAHSQTPNGPQSGVASLVGTVTSIDGLVVPGATVTVDGVPAGPQTATANEDGFFSVKNLPAGVPLHVTVAAPNFTAWSADNVVLAANESHELRGIVLKVAMVAETVRAVSEEEIAREQVMAQEKQRVLGFIPNFYVTYEKNPVPLTTKLKYQLAWKSGTDVITMAGAMFIGGIDQALDTPHYQQGLKGYGQRVGASYADGFTDIIIGGAVLPSLLHQDPRYFYLGPDAPRKKRIEHAMLYPFLCRGDGGHTEFNFSGIGGDLISASLMNTYYPNRDRGAGLVFTNASVTIAGEMANAFAQEFILRKFTHRGKVNDKKLAHEPDVK